MLGSIVGDVLGSVHEFKPIKTKDFELFSPNCNFTDDTVMTVAVAEACMKTGYKFSPRLHIDLFGNAWGT